MKKKSKSPFSFYRVFRQASLQKVALHCKILKGRREAEYFLLDEGGFYEKNNFFYNPMFLTFRPELSRGVRVGCLPSPEHLTQPPDRHQRHQEWSVSRPVSGLQSPDVMFQWVVAGGACGCGQWTSRAAGERMWTACAARTTGGSTPCPASTPGDTRLRSVTVFFNVIMSV